MMPPTLYTVPERGRQLIDKGFLGAINQSVDNYSPALLLVLEFPTSVPHSPHYDPGNTSSGRW